jgi:23S rRNA pseudouridine2605 synthase
MSGGGRRKRQAGGTSAGEGERVAKAIARAGLCSRRDAERLIVAGRVAVNGAVLASPAVTVTPADLIMVDGRPLAPRERTRLWLFNKPKGLVSTNRDPQGRPTIFSALPADLPRVVSVGRLDINTEGLILLTNDGGLARVLELPSTGWLRRYRVRVHGNVDAAALAVLRQGISIDGAVYGAIDAAVDRVQGTNAWLTVALREGKNREIKRVMEHLDLAVTRLIRVSFGPFQLGDLRPGEVREVKGRVLKDQLGEKLARAAGVDFSAERTAAKVGAESDARGRRRSPHDGAEARPRVRSPRKHADRRRPI